VGGEGGGGQVVPRITVTCSGSQGNSCPCSPFMTRVEVPGSSFMLCLGPGHSSLLHLTRANAEKPYAGGTPSITYKITPSRRGPSPPASQADRRVGPALWPHWQKPLRYSQISLQVAQQKIRLAGKSLSKYDIFFLLCRLMFK
jgi:hypothetical protein